MNGLLVFIEMKQKNAKWPTQKNDQKPHFPVELIDAKGIGVAQPTWS